MEYSSPPPNHIAIIMDGNGRWAKSRGMTRSMGHRKGAETLKKLLGEAQNIGIKYMTLYAFSAENWQRPKSEISDLMGLLQYYLERETSILLQHEIKLQVIGNLNEISSTLKTQIQDIMAITSKFDKLCLTIALSYGARQEIVYATQQIACAVKQQSLPIEAIDEQLIASKLYTHNLPDPDLLIRTGGEQRLSNFLLWQSAYAELYFTETLWPDFTVKDLAAAIDTYRKRERRYGKI